MFELPTRVKRIAVYLRRSREDLEAEKRGEDTLRAQRDLMTQHVLPQFQRPFAVFAEVESGDTIRDRPVFQQLLRSLGTDYQAIAIKDLSRLGRGNYGDMGIVYDVIRDHDIYVITRDSVFDPGNEDHKRAIRMSMFISREEYESIVLRLTNGKYDKARDRGFWVAGSTPYGYSYNRNTRKLQANQDAEIVRTIYTLYVQQGLSCHSIAKYLRASGIKTATGKDYWNPQVIRRMLRNPAYAGDLQFRKTKRLKSDNTVTPRPAAEHIWHRNAHEAIVDRDTWNRAQDRTEHQLPKTASTFEPSELAGLVTCLGCGRKMVRQTITQRYQKRNSSEVSIYQKEFLACLACGHYVQYRRVEEQIVACLGALPLDAAVLSTSLSDQLTRGSTQADDTAIIARLQDDLHKTKQHMEKNALAYLDGTFTKSVYQTVQQRLESERGILEDRLAYVKENHQSRESLGKSSRIQTFQEEIEAGRSHTIADIYRPLKGKPLQNQLLRAVFRSVVLEFLGKQGRNNAFALHLYLSS